MLSLIIYLDSQQRGALIRNVPLFVGLANTLPPTIRVKDLQKQNTHALTRKNTLQRQKTPLIEVLMKANAEQKQQRIMFFLFLKAAIHNCNMLAPEEAQSPHSWLNLSLDTMSRRYIFTLKLMD